MKRIRKVIAVVFVIMTLLPLITGAMEPQDYRDEISFNIDKLNTPGGGDSYLTPKEEKLSVSYGTKLRVYDGGLNNGKLFQPTDANGENTYLFLWSGTTYVPLRAIFGLYGLEYGKDVIYDTEKYEVVLYTNNNPIVHPGKIAEDKPGWDKTITVVTGVKLLINGEYVVPKDVNGVVKPVILYNGTTYVPIRTLAEIFGTKIDWDGLKNEVIIGDKNANSGDIDISNFNEYQLEAYGYVQQAKALLPTMKANWKYLWDSRANLLRVCAVGKRIRNNYNITKEESDKVDEAYANYEKYYDLISYYAPENMYVELENNIMSIDYSKITNSTNAYGVKLLLQAIEGYIDYSQEMIDEIKPLDLKSWADYINNLAIKYNFNERVDFLE